MDSTYRAMQIARPGVLELVHRPLPTPGPGAALIAVEACGVCGADVGDIERAGPALDPPRVPGHEVVGRIVALPEGTASRWVVGQRVGVGRLGGPCGECVACRRGEFQLCERQPIVGATCDGGYAEAMLARQSGLVAIPDALDSVDAAPLLCAGIATFNALRKSGASAGDRVAIQGIGGLGHMALQYARRMGFEVVAIGRGADIADDARRLGAHVYIDAAIDDAAAALQRMGGAQAIVATSTDAAAVTRLLPGLAPRGSLILLGVAKEPLHIAAGAMIRGERSIAGSITGTPYDTERALAFSVLVDARPVVETMPLERANEAYQRVKSGAPRFRIALTMREPAPQSRRGTAVAGVAASRRA
ncbi:MAG: alcohol dehydrogenase catalytic domain-containing protein [Burkholderiales bacterium]|nr:alcohol dehydrogenase catalytic domain-containing protein [Burkholderiales bacterium]